MENIRSTWNVYFFIVIYGLHIPLFFNIVSFPLRLCNVLSSWFVLQMLFLKIKICRETFARQEFIACQKKKRSVAWRTAECWYQAGFESKKYNSKIREIHFSKREEILHRGAAALVSSGGSWWVINHSQNYLQPKVVKCLRAGKTEKYKVRGKWGLAWGLKESTRERVFWRKYSRAGVGGPQ